LIEKRRSVSILTSVKDSLDMIISARMATVLMSSADSCATAMMASE